MKKGFFVKATIVICLFYCFFFIWQINSAKAFCEIQKECLRIPVLSNPVEVDSQVFPYDDLIIKV